MAEKTPSTTAPATSSEGPKEQAAQAATAGKDQAGQVAAGAKEQAAAVASTAASEAKAVASEAAGEAKNVLADARQQLRTQADEQAGKVASLVGDIGSQLRTMADAGNAGPAKDVVATLADQAEQMSRRLGDGGLDRTLEDARRMARNRPGLFLAGAALAGFVAARVARAADTDSLKQAVSPSNGSSGNGHELGSPPELQGMSGSLPPQSLDVGASGGTPASQPLGAGASGGAPAPRPLVAEPMPAMEDAMSAMTDPSSSSTPANSTQPIASEQSLGELFSRMTSDVGQLVSTQVELAKVEIKEEVSRAGKGAGMVGGGGVAALLGVLLISFAIAYWIGDALDNLGTGYLIVGLVYAAIAAVLVLKGKQQITSATPIAEQTIEEIKEDVEWAKQQRT